MCRRENEIYNNREYSLSTEHAQLLFSVLILKAGFKLNARDPQSFLAFFDTYQGHLQDILLLLSECPGGEAVASS